MYDTLMILIFCNNVLCHIRRTGGHCAIFVECTAYCCDEMLFGVLDSVNCTAFRNMMYHLRLPPIF